MRRHDAYMKRVAWAVLLLSLALAGCAGGGDIRPESSNAVDTAVRTVQPGDTADVRYLCRLRNGDLVAATETPPGDQPKSHVFMMTTETGPLQVTAAAFEMQPPEKREKSLEEEIRLRLSIAVIGMRDGEKRRVELTTHDIPESDAQNYVAHLSRVRRRPKEMRMPKGDYEVQTGRTAEAGQFFSYDPAFPGQVAEVTEQEVVIRFPKPGDTVETPLGTGYVREEENEYKIDIDARVGTLIMAGGTLGRITDVDDQVITIDFRNPFGGETLICDVEVANIAEIKQTKNGAGE
jgi:FKBP-type peptidyl-prolyl cis-trans isomerase 2